MIQWRTDIENAPKDGTRFIVPSQWNDGTASGLYPNNGFPPIAGRPGRFGQEKFTHWSEVNLP